MPIFLWSLVVTHEPMAVWVHFLRAALPRVAILPTAIGSLLCYATLFQTLEIGHKLGDLIRAQCLIATEIRGRIAAIEAGHVAGGLDVLCMQDPARQVLIGILQHATSDELTAAKVRQVRADELCARWPLADGMATGASSLLKDLLPSRFRRAGGGLHRASLLAAHPGIVVRSRLGDDLEVHVGMLRAAELGACAAEHTGNVSFEL